MQMRYYIHHMNELSPLILNYTKRMEKFCHKRFNKNIDQSCEDKVVLESIGRNSGSEAWDIFVNAEV